MRHFKQCEQLSFSWLKTATAALALCFSSAASAQQVPATPSGLRAAADYSKVVLTWELPAQTDTLLKENFEAAALPEGWSVRTTNTYDPFFTWFHFPTPDMMEAGVSAEDYAEWAHESQGSAMLLLDTATPHDDESPATQDEWLVLPPTEGAQYVDFFYYLPEQLAEWGAEDYFPDHYYVKVSHDGGETWKVVWDGRYEIAKGYGHWNHATVCLGSPAGGTPIVAFQALSDAESSETGLYCSWAIDDVTLLGAKGSADGALLAESYNVYLDGELIAEGVKATEYTDTITKTAGTHTYGVEAVSESCGTKSAVVQVNVDIAQATVNPPTEVKVTYEYDEASGRYSVDMTWNKPEGAREPSYYMAYANGALIGGYITEMGVGQTGIPKGFYKYTVKAIYELPYGESEAVGDVVALGTRQAPYDLSYTRSDDNALTLVWTAAKPSSDHELRAYAVYRGNERLGETTETAFVENDSPCGTYDYSVKAVYADGVESLPATVEVSYGEKPVYVLPFNEDFTGGLKPGNWTIEKLNGKMKDSYLWRFDNFYELPVGGQGFDGEFASICSSVAGVTNVFATMDTPPLVRGAKEGERTFLEFDMDFKTLAQEAVGYVSEAGVYFSYDGEMWKDIDEELAGYTDADLAQASQSCAPVHKVYDITDCFADNDTPIYIAWRYKGRKAFHLAIDNVRVYNALAASVDAAQSQPDGVSYGVSDGVLRIKASGISRVSIYSVDGTCKADVCTGSVNDCSLPLGKGLHVARVVTAAGVKTFKVSR